MIGKMMTKIVKSHKNAKKRKKKGRRGIQRKHGSGRTIDQR